MTFAYRLGPGRASLPIHCPSPQGPICRACGSINHARKQGTSAIPRCGKLVGDRAGHPLDMCLSYRIHTYVTGPALTHLCIRTESHNRPKALQITAVQYGEQDNGSSKEGAGEEGSSGKEGRSEEAGSEEEEVSFLFFPLGSGPPGPEHRAPFGVPELLFAA